MNIAIIPARGGSKRIPKKNILDFLGKPLISYALDAVKESGVFDKIHVSTDDDEILKVINSLGYEIDFIRDHSLADDFTGLMPVVEWVIEKYEEDFSEKYSNICMILPTVPLINASDIKSAFSLYKEHECKYVTMASCKFSIPPQWALKKDKHGLLNPQIPDNLKIRSQDLEPLYYDSGTFYIFSKNHLGTVLGENTVPYLLPSIRSVDIDNLEDLEYAKFLYKYLESK